MAYLPDELKNLILINLPKSKLIFINKYYNNYKYCILKQIYPELNPYHLLRRFPDLQIKLTTHSKYDFFKNMEDIPRDEKYVFEMSNSPRNRKGHTIPPEIYKNLETYNLFLYCKCDCLILYICKYLTPLPNLINYNSGVAFYEDYFNYIDNLHKTKINTTYNRYDFYERSQFV